MYGLSLSPRKPGLGPKHVFQKLPQVSYKEIDDFDDMLGINDVLTQRKMVSSPEVKQQPKHNPQIKPKETEKPKMVESVPKPQAKSQPKIAPVQQKPEKPVQKGNLLIKMEELKKHNTPEDGWVAIRGEVFEVTDYIKRHPGGQNAIKKVLGTDGTKLFGKPLLTRKSS